MRSTNLRIISIIGAVALVLLALTALVAGLFSKTDITVLAPIITGFVSPSITALIIFGITNRSSGEQENDDEHNH